MLPFLLRFPNGDVYGWRRRIDPFVWIFLALSYVMYVVEWRAYYELGSIPSWDVIPSTVIPLAAFLFAGLILAKNLRRRRQATANAGVRGNWSVRVVRGVCGLLRSRRTVRGRASRRLRRRADADLHRLCRIQAARARRKLRAQPRAGLRRLVAGRNRVRLDFGLVLLARRRARPAGGRARTARHDRDRLSARSHQSFGRRLRRSHLLSAPPNRRAACCVAPLRRFPTRPRKPRSVDGLVQVPVDALDLAAAALYRRSAGGARFEGVATARQTTIAPPGFGANDLLVRMLLADEKIVWLDELRSHLDPQNAAIYTSGGPGDACVTSSFRLRSTVRTPTARNSIPMRSSCSRSSPAKPLGPTITSRPSARASGIRSC